MDIANEEYIMERKLSGESHKNKPSNRCILQRVGKTPLVRLDSTDFAFMNLYGKLEMYNPTGSVKDRAASHILRKILENGEITQQTTIIESSSGNFGVALAAYAGLERLNFICVTDPHISTINKMLISAFGGHIDEVNVPDQYGGYLLQRIERVKELQVKISDSYWVEQYRNPYNAEAYYLSLGQEVCDEMDSIDYIFVGVSSGGTITGLSKKIKEEFPKATIIAVDIEGSVIFGAAARNRVIPGIGSSMVPKILEHAMIDDVVWVNEQETIESCQLLLKQHCIFAGGSSGSVYAAIKKYFQMKGPKKNKINVVAILPDRGERYVHTIYNSNWCRRIIN
jgi:N-(2-amino-2-carboxyethyl)-L-glutamate synthase